MLSTGLPRLVYIVLDMTNHEHTSLKVLVVLYKKKIKVSVRSGLYLLVYIKQKLVQSQANSFCSGGKSSIFPLFREGETAVNNGAGGEQIKALEPAP